MPLSVSVALCTFNGARFVGEQVESILSQTRAADELVVADDGSNDNTLDLVSSAVASRGAGAPTLRVLDARGRFGVTRNFERAIGACVGDLVALCDQDDVWHANRLAAAVPSFERDNDLLLQHSDARLVDETGNPLGVTLIEALALRPQERAAIESEHPFPAYIRRNLVTGATVLLRREAMIAAAGAFPTTWVHDEWLAVIAAAVGKVEFFDQALIDYRQHGFNQIGVAAPTLRYRLGRVTGKRGDRYVGLERRSVALRDRLTALDVRNDYLALTQAKVQFESVRAGYPRSRPARLGPVLRERRRGSYRLLSGQGNLDVVRDLLQPA